MMMASLSDISIKFNEAVLTEIIKKAGGTRYTSFEFGKGFNKGDSYLSKVFRLCVYGINEATGGNVKVHLIVKAMPDNKARRSLFHSADFFRNEINFYEHIIPVWEAFQSRRQPKNPFTEYPKCYAWRCDGENDFIALEDVSVLGYDSPNRQEYVTLEECRLIMATLGRFHGMSLVLQNLEPEEFAKCINSVQETYYMERNREWYMGFMRLACSVAKDAIEKTYPHTEYEIIAKNFLQDHLYDDLIDLVSKKSKYSVITHGDCWIPNFLTCYSAAADGKAEAIKIKMIDFQLTRYASFALDISIFLYSCTSQALRETHFESLLRTYYDSMSDLILDMGRIPEEIISWPSILDEFKEFGRFGCGMGIETLPLSLIEEDEVADLNNIQAVTVLTDIWNIKPFEAPNKTQRIADIFKHAIDIGCIK